MVLPRTKRNLYLKDLKNVCARGEFGQSTWTIDLCYVLKEFNVEHKYLTSTIGINPEHEVIRFYSRVIKKDADRVSERFQAAKKNDILVEERTVTGAFLRHHLVNYGPVICLVNSNLLQCSLCKTVDLQKDFG